MSTVFEIPLTSHAQKFSIVLAGQRYWFALRWNDAPLGGWILDISDNASNPLVSGIPLITGTDLLAQYAKLDFGGQLFMATDGSHDAPPRIDNLGAPGGSRMYWVTTP